MKFLSAFLFCAAVVIHAADLIPGADQQIDESLIREARTAIQRGVQFLMNRQMSDGAWGIAFGEQTFGHPAITALACMAISQSGRSVAQKDKFWAVENGREYILKFVQKDGSICSANSGRDYPAYTTAIALTCLATLRYKEDEPVMRAARKFLIGLQLDENNPDMPLTKDNPKYGGIGYGPGKAGARHADTSNTQWVAEALHASEYLVHEPYSKNPADAKEADLAWGKLAQFLTNMQHLPQTNKAAWVTADPKNDNYGGFVYHVEDSEDGPDGKTGRERSLSAYGSMTYAGLKSMLYAKLTPDDPRVKAAAEWASKHYTVNENPGMGPAGLFYYLQTFAKAHAALGKETVKTVNGETRKWREDLIRKLVSSQKADGSWVNDANGRWMESSPELVTAYCLMSLELALGNAG